MLCYSSPMSKHKYIIGHVNGEIVTQRGAAQPECCEDCGGAYHPRRGCHIQGRAYDEYEGHHGDE